MILQAEDDDKNQHMCQCVRGHCNNVEKGYNAGKCKHFRLMKELKKLSNYAYGVQFPLETDAHTSVHQHNLAANDQPRALVTHWILWI